MRISRKSDGVAVWLVAAMLAAPVLCPAQQCGAGAADVHGTVTDGSGAPIAGAALTAGRVTAKSGADGQFVLPCVQNDAVIQVEAPSFAVARVKAAAAAHVVLLPLAAHEEISVTAYKTPLSESASP
ncbi:MAG TPA: carboxypeptidase-like regulatory domain-containing protein, partial [Acidobacteriaceae bacterium]|nr:carboxypeptidase-like regulatory domain-containing protein [Acidobacteriaceae bacterium]